MYHLSKYLLYNLLYVPCFEKINIKSVRIKHKINFSDFVRNKMRAISCRLDFLRIVHRFSGRLRRLRSIEIL